MTNVGRAMAGLGLAVSLAVAGYFAGRRLLPPSPAPATVRVLPVSADCEPLGHPCRASDGAVTLAFSLPQRVTPLASFTMTVQVQGEAARQVNVQYLMQGMDMGLNLYPLVRQAAAPAGTGASVWQAKGMLPVCSASRLDWVAVVTVESTSGRYQARFPFRAHKP